MPLQNIYLSFSYKTSLIIWHDFMAQTQKLCTLSRHFESPHFLLYWFISMSQKSEVFAQFCARFELDFVNVKRKNAQNFDMCLASLPNDRLSRDPFALCLIITTANTNHAGACRFYSCFTAVLSCLAWCRSVIVLVVTRLVSPLVRFASRVFVHRSQSLV